MARLDAIWCFDRLHFGLSDSSGYRGGFTTLDRTFGCTKNCIYETGWLVRTIAAPSLIQWSEE